MRKFQFTVEVEFQDEDEVTQDQIGTVAKNILSALVAECESGPGLSPEESETWTKSIKVTDQVTNSTISATL